MNLRSPSLSPRRRRSSLQGSAGLDYGPSSGAAGRIGWCALSQGDLRNNCLEDRVGTLQDSGQGQTAIAAGAALFLTEANSTMRNGYAACSDASFSVGADAGCAAARVTPFPEQHGAS